MRKRRAYLMFSGFALMAIAGTTVGVNTYQQHRLAPYKTAKQQKVQTVVQNFPTTVVKTKAQKADDLKTKGIETPYDTQLTAQGKKPKEMTLAEKSDTYVKMTLSLSAEAAAQKSSTSNPDGTSATLNRINQAEQNVIDQQTPIKNRAEQITGKKVLKQSGYLVNTLSIMAKPTQVKQLSTIAGVKEVHIQSVYHPANSNDNDLAQVTDDWRSAHGGDGSGMLIADIDSGIDYTHPDLKLTTTGSKQAKLSKDSSKLFQKFSSYGVYQSNKVPFAHNYADNIDSQDELKDNGITHEHGQHVAGILAANGKVKGVAPEAQLLDMKVFSNHHNGASTDSIVDAIEDSVKLGADVLNLSLGSSLTNYSSLMPETAALNRAAKLGVVPVVAASNDGRASAEQSDLHTVAHNPEEDISISSMSLADGAISVASMEGTQTHALTTNFSDSTGKTFSDKVPVRVSPGIPDDFWTKKHTIRDNGVPWSDEGYNYDETKKADWLSKGFNLATDAHKIKIIQYNPDPVANTTVKDMQRTAKKNDVDMVILIDYKDRSLPSCEFAPVDDENAPAMLISYQSGRQLLAKVRELAPDYYGKEPLPEDASAEDANKRQEVANASLTAPTTTTADNQDTGKMSTFTSWGCTPDLNLKPDVTGVGGNIWSLSNKDYAQMSGTSMASPFVAGTVALLKQQANKQHVNLGQGSNKFIKNMKTLLQNTAQPVYSKDGQAYYSPRQQGAGLVQVDNAIKSHTVVTDAKDQDGAVDLKSFSGQTKTFTLNIKNVGNKAATYSVKGLGGVATEIRTTDSKAPNEVGIRTTYNSNGDALDTTSLNGVGTYYYRDEQPYLDLVSEHNIANATLTASQNQVSVPAGQTKTVAVTVTVPKTQAKQSWVEGYVQVKSTKDSEPAANIPYFGYYGNWDAGQVIDKPAQEKGSIKGWGYLGDSHYLRPLMTGNTGIASNEYVTQYTSDNDHAAISFQKSSAHQSAVDLEYMLRWTKEIDVDVLGADKKTVLTHLATYQQSKPGLITTEWNGTVPNPKTGKSDKVADGVYYIRTKAKMLDGAKTETVFPKLTVDNVMPKVANAHLKYQKDGVHLTADINEKGSGMFDLSNDYTGGKVDLRLNSILSSNQFDTPEKEKTSGWLHNHFDILLNEQQVENLKQQDNKVEMTLRDRAGNGDWFENQLKLSVEGTKETKKQVDKLASKFSVDYQNMIKQTKVDGEYSDLSADADRVHIDTGEHADPNSAPSEHKSINAFDLKAVDSKYWSIQINGSWNQNKSFNVTSCDSQDKQIDHVIVTAKDGNWSTRIKVGKLGYLKFTDASGKELTKPVVPEIPIGEGIDTQIDQAALATESHGKWIKRGDQEILVVPYSTSSLNIKGAFTGAHTPDKMLIYNNQVIDQDSHTIRIAKPIWTDNHLNMQVYTGQSGLEKNVEATKLPTDGSYSGQVSLWDAQTLANLQNNSLDLLKTTSNYEGGGLKDCQSNGLQSVQFTGYEAEYSDILPRIVQPEGGNWFFNPEFATVNVSKNDPLRKYIWQLSDFSKTFSLPVYRLPEGESLSSVKDNGVEKDSILPLKPEHSADSLGLDDKHPIMMIGSDVVITPSNLLDENGALRCYNPFTQDLTITGYAIPTIKNLRFVLNSANPDDASNQVKVNPDGSFKFVAHHVGPVVEKAFVVKYDQTINGQTTAQTQEHALKINLSQPAIHLDIDTHWVQRPNSHHFDVYTSNTSFTLSGQVSAYNTGVAVNVNGENVFVGKTNWDDASKYGTPYLGFAPEKFSKTYQLNKHETTTYNIMPYQLTDTGNVGDTYEIVVHQVGK
ncbi:S8 family serine peptidase [Leuconostoc pseudomesenteroides]|uniref:S8 family serine peptidase n=1 Tax=Leuconostoc pseudomesenteroides TaxID=33968 RepID=UPI0039ED540F